MTSLDPIARFQDSYARAAQSESFDASRAALATRDATGRVAVRYVLVKGINPEGFAFYTNLESPKARQLSAWPQAALAFHWPSTGEQVRIDGRVARVSDAEADAYFATRPHGSQLAAWASRQSQPLSSRAELIAQFDAARERFSGQAVARPEHWGGFRLLPDTIEFWHDQPDRLHNRVLFTRVGAAWQTTLLSP